MNERQASVSRRDFVKGGSALLGAVPALILFVVGFFIRRISGTAVFWGALIAQIVVLIIFFTYFYTAVTFNPVDVADNLKKYGGFIPGIRPGRYTAEYIERVLSRINEDIGSDSVRSLLFFFSGASTFSLLAKARLWL